MIVLKKIENTKFGVIYIGLAKIMAVGKFHIEYTEDGATNTSLVH